MKKIKTQTLTQHEWNQSLLNPTPHRNKKKYFRKEKHKSSCFPEKQFVYLGIVKKIKKRVMTKSIKTLVAVLALAVSFTSCTQEETPTPTPLGDLRLEAAGKYEYHYTYFNSRENTIDTSMTFYDMELFVDSTSSTGMYFNWKAYNVEVTNQDATGFDAILTEQDGRDFIEVDMRWNRDSSTMVWIYPEGYSVNTLHAKKQ